MAHYNQPKKVADCCLCKEIETGIFPAEYAAVYGVDKRICFESDNFVVIPSVSPIAVGHTMLLPKRHYTSIMSCPDELKEEAMALIEMLYEKLSAKFGDLFLFEHGVGSLEDTACGINHAHLHFAPLQHSNFKSVVEGISKRLGHANSTSLRSSFCGKENKSAYLLYGTEPSKMQFSGSKIIPSQLVRSVISEQLGTDCYDWKSLSKTFEFLKTLESLSTVN